MGNHLFFRCTSCGLTETYDFDHEQSGRRSYIAIYG
jgi:hypothetical protein